jgi:hypothetical protein
VQEPILARLAEDLAALQRDGLSDEELAEVYATLLSLGTLDDQTMRAAALEAAIRRADATGALHLRIVSRLLALSLRPEDQRATAAELSRLLADRGDETES